MESTVTATGTVNAVTTVLVGTQVSGTIKNLFADFNSLVKKGQILAQIDPATFQAQVEQAQANLLRRSQRQKARSPWRIQAHIGAEQAAFGEKSHLPRAILTPRRPTTCLPGPRWMWQGPGGAGTAALKMAETNLRYTRISPR